jgi:beta-galactosidase
MNAGDQQTIVDYTKSGGNLVIFPYLPDREMSQKPCTIIRDALSICPSGKEVIDSPLIDVFDLEDIKCANPQSIFSEESLAGAEIIARTIRGSACGFIKKLGSGSLTHLGTWIGFDTEGQKPVYEAILNRSDAKLRQTTSNNEKIAVRERFTSENAAVLFVANYYNEEQTAKISYTHPLNGETISIPYLEGEMQMPALYGILTPVCMGISEGLKILHSTSDILEIAKTDSQIQLTIYGDRDLAGEIVFEGLSVKSIRSATINGEEVKIMYKEKRAALIYIHKHNNEMILSLKLK